MCGIRGQFSVVCSEPREDVTITIIKIDEENVMYASRPDSPHGVDVCVLGFSYAIFLYFLLFFFVLGQGMSDTTMGSYFFVSIDRKVFVDYESILNSYTTSVSNDGMYSYKYIYTYRG